MSSYDEFLAETQGQEQATPPGGEAPNPYLQRNQEAGFWENFWEGAALGRNRRLLGGLQLGMEATGYSDTDLYKKTQKLATKYRQQAEGTGAGGVVGEIVGDPLTYLGGAAGAKALQQGGKLGLKGLAALGYGGGSVAGGTEAISEDQNRLAGTIGSGAIGAAAAPVLGGTLGILGKLGDKAINTADDVYKAVRQAYSRYGDDVVEDALGIEIKGLVSFKDFDKAVKSLGDDAVASFRQATKAGLSPKQAYIATKAQREGIGLTRGQITQDPGLQRLEDQAALKSLGDDAYQVARDTAQAQKSGMFDYGKRILSRVSSNTSPLTDETSVADSVGRAFRNLNKKMHKKASNAFDVGGKTEARINIELMKDLPGQVRKSLSEAGFDVGDMPKLQRQLNTMTRATKVFEGRGGSVKYKFADVFRKRLYKAYDSGGDPAEKEALRQLYGAYNDRLDDIITKDLLTQPDDAVKVLREAPALWRNYKQTIFGKDGKAALGQIVKKDLTDRQVADLFGSGVWGKGDTQNVVKHLKGALGEKSPEYGQVRGMFFNRLLRGALDGSADDVGSKDFGVRLISDIKTLKTNNNALYDELYTPAMQKEIEAFANIAWTMSHKVKSKITPSGHDVAGALSGLIRRLGHVGSAESIVFTSAADAFSGVSKYSATKKQGQEAIKSILTPLLKQGSDSRVISDALKTLGASAGATQSGRQTREQF